MKFILMALLGMAGLWFSGWWRAGGDQEQANELADGVGGINGVPVVCLWCYREAARILRPAVGTVESVIICQNCGKALVFVTNDGNGKWRIS